MLDRAVNFSTDLSDSLKLGLLSMGATMRSNLSVGLPIDIASARRGACRLDINHRIENADPYFHELRDLWSAGLRQAHQNIPCPPYGNPIAEA